MPPRAAVNGRPRTLGPLNDLEPHLRSDWWRTLFNATYLKTDGDVVENAANTSRETQTLIDSAGLRRGDRILDLCCGQGRHCLELARRGFSRVTGIDRSAFLVRLARRRAARLRPAPEFHEGDARRLPFPDASFDCVAVLGNSFGYFEREEEDRAVLLEIRRVLGPAGRVVLDLVDGVWMLRNFAPRSWEWIDQHSLVCRERALAHDGQRLISREVVIHAQRGILADQFYAERLYSRGRVEQLLRDAGFGDIRQHEELEAQSTRNQDLGMMARRILVSARRTAAAAVAFANPSAAANHRPKPNGRHAGDAPTIEFPAGRFAERAALTRPDALARAPARGRALRTSRA